MSNLVVKRILALILSMTICSTLCSCAKREHNDISTETTNGILFSDAEWLKELYLIGVDSNRPIAITQMRKNYLRNDDTYSTIIKISYSDNNELFVAYYGGYVSGEHVVTLTNSKDDVIGFAYVDFSLIADGKSYNNIALSINTAHALNIDNSPHLAEHISENGTDHIVENNLDIEETMIRSTCTLPDGTPGSALTFVHFSDVHASLRNWKRIVAYIDTYEKYLDFAIHTGDIVGSYNSAYSDLYQFAKPNNISIYNVCGDHDCYADSTYEVDVAPEDAYNVVFADAENWNVTFGEEEYALYYYRDWEEHNIRLIVINDQNWSYQQSRWLDTALREAEEMGYSVITASHLISSAIVAPLNCTFHSPEVFNEEFPKNQFEDNIVRFIEAGGSHIVHLAGDNHLDYIGYTESGILNISVNSASADAKHTDSERPILDKNYDCFNVVSIDPASYRINIVRIGNNINNTLQEKNVLCYNYLTHEIISNW